MVISPAMDRKYSRCLFRSRSTYNSQVRSSIARQNFQHHSIIYDVGTTLDEDCPLNGKIVIEKVIPGWWATWEGTIYAADGHIIYKIVVQDRITNGKATVKNIDYGVGFKRVRLRITSAFSRGINCHIQLYGRPDEYKIKAKTNLLEPAIPNHQV